MYNGISDMYENSEISKDEINASKTVNESNAVAILTKNAKNKGKTNKLNKDKNNKPNQITYKLDSIQFTEKMTKDKDKERIEKSILHYQAKYLYIKDFTVETPINDYVDDDVDMKLVGYKYDQSEVEKYQIVNVNNDNNLDINEIINEIISEICKITMSLTNIKIHDKFNYIVGNFLAKLTIPSLASYNVLIVGSDYIFDYLGHYQNMQNRSKIDHKLQLYRLSDDKKHDLPYIALSNKVTKKGKLNNLNDIQSIINQMIIKLDIIIIEDINNITELYNALILSSTLDPYKGCCLMNVTKLLNNTLHLVSFIQLVSLMYQTRLIKLVFNNNIYIMCSGRKYLIDYPEVIKFVKKYPNDYPFKLDELNLDILNKLKFDNTDNMNNKITSTDYVSYWFENIDDELKE